MLASFIGWFTPTIYSKYQNYWFFFFIEFSLSLLRGTLSERLNSYLYFKTVCIQINYTLFGDQYRIIFGVYNQWRAWTMTLFAFWNIMQSKWHLFLWFTWFTVYGAMRCCPDILLVHCIQSKGTWNKLMLFLSLSPSLYKSYWSFSFWFCLFCIKSFSVASSPFNVNNSKPHTWSDHMPMVTCHIVYDSTSPWRLMH